MSGKLKTQQTKSMEAVPQATQKTKSMEAVPQAPDPARRSNTKMASPGPQTRKEALPQRVRCRSKTPETKRCNVAYPPEPPAKRARTSSLLSPNWSMPATPVSDSRARPVQEKQQDEALPVQKEKPKCWYCGHRCGVNAAGNCHYCERPSKKEAAAKEAASPSYTALGAASFCDAAPAASVEAVPDATAGALPEPGVPNPLPQFPENPKALKTRNKP